MKIINREINRVFIDYLDTYFVRRDINSTLNLLSSRITGFGTGIDEKSYSYKEHINLYKRDINQAPEPIHYEIQKIHITSPTENTGIVLCELNIQTQILSQKVKLNHLRLSMFWVKHHQTWLAEHMHISLPTETHTENEAYPIKELEERNTVLQRLVTEKTTKLNEAFCKISKLAKTDKLTGLFNRIKTEESISNELQRSERYGTKFSIIMIDIDHFKYVNDTFGHLAGDKMLVAFSDILSRRVRKADICGRWGGEEFIIICPETPLQEGTVLAENLRHTFEAHTFETAGKRTASFGITDNKKNDTIESIIGRADKALYEAKNKGRNRVCSN